MISLAIAILNWNGKDNLEKFLPSVIQNSKFEGTKVYIIDNGSNDGSIEYLKSNFHGIEIIQLDKNYGFASGYNKGLRKIKAEYYLILNSDVEVTENWLAPLVEIMQSEDRIAACMPKLRSYTNRDYFEYAGAAGGFIDKFGYPFCQGRIFYYNEQDLGQYDEIRTVFWATGACLLIKSSLFFKAGGFDDDFFAHMEEIDLCWRLKNMGYNIMINPKSVAYHLGGATLPKSNPEKTYLNFRNNLFLLFKNLPNNKLAKVLIIRYFFDLLAVILFITELKFKDAFAVFRAYFAFIISIKILIKKRKQLKNKFNLNSHPEIFNKSIVWQFYIREKKTFSELTF